MSSTNSKRPLYNDPVWLALQQNESYALNGVVMSAAALVPVGGTMMLGLFFWDGLVLVSGVLALFFIGLMVSKIAQMKRIASDRKHREQWVCSSSAVPADYMTAVRGERDRSEGAAISRYRNY